MKAIETCIGRNWSKIFTHVNKAVVFVENIVAEALHWQGGLARLMQAGAVDVKEFSSFECGGEHDKKAVFLVGSLLEGVTREILCDILQASKFQYVVVIISQGSAVHTFSRTDVTEDDDEFFGQVEDRLLEWMGNMNYTAEVIHIPLDTVNVGNSVFITPNFAKFFPLMSSDLHQIELQYNNRHSKSEQRDFDNLKAVDCTGLPKDLQVFVKSLVGSLDSLLGDLGMKEDIFSLGYTSAILATELEAFPPARNRRKTATEKASLLLVDGSLDLAALTSHNTDSLLDRIQQVLPRLPGHVTDVSVDMSPLCNIHQETVSDTVAPGSLATLSGSQNHLQTLITGKQKDALMEMNRQIIEAASNCGLPVSLSGRPTKISAEQINSTVKLFKGKYKEINKHLDWLQVAMATSQTLSDPRIAHCEELICVEKSLQQSLSDPDDEEALGQVLQMLKRKLDDKWMYSLDDVLCKLVYVYSLAGQTILDQDDTEAQLQDLFLDRVMTEKELPPLIKSIVGDVSKDRSMVSDVLEGVWDKLASVTISREHLQHFRSVLDPGSAVSPASHNALLRQLLEAILDEDKPDLVDVEYKSAGLRDKLKSGFGLFRGVGKPRPCDNPLLIIFVIGGINCTAVKQIKDILSHTRSNIQVVVGSTRLVTPEDITHSVLCEDNINPSSNT